MIKGMFLAASFAVSNLFVLCAADAEEAKPNIVVILCDDLGYGDLENFGHPVIKTPHLMKMAAEGVQFSRFYSAAPVCSPSRVGLLTGRNPNRAGVYDWIPGANPDKPLRGSRNLVEMRKSEFTIAKMLKSAGYATCMSGKWHCNAMFNSEKQAQPGDHGFDHWFATQNNAAPSHENPVNFVRNGTPTGKVEGYSCEIVVDEAVRWIQNHKETNPEQPFFAYIAFHEPHEPVASPPEMVEKYEKGGAENHDEAQYFANVENIDAATGKLLAALNKMNLGDNTLVIFTSDNGPETLNRYRSAKRSYGSPGPLRGMKLHTHEAGFRVAGIMRWPEKIEAGTLSDEAVSALDFLPTFASISGAEIPSDLELDGTNFLPAASGKELQRKRPLLWVYYNSYTEAGNHMPSVAMIDGDVKIRATLQGVKPTSQIDQNNQETMFSATLGNFEQFNLGTDMAEKSPVPTEEITHREALIKAYQEAVKTFHVWPSLEKSP